MPSEWEGPEFEVLQIFEAFREQGRKQWRESQCALACETEAELQAILARGAQYTQADEGELDHSYQERLSWDSEQDHSDANEALLRLLNLLGYGFVVEAYRKIEKWYA